MEVQSRINGCPFRPSPKGKGSKSKSKPPPGHYAAQCPQTAKRSTTTTSTSSSKKTKGETGMMVSIEMKDLTTKPTGLHGTLDGGSCMVLGHETLMHYIEHYHQVGSLPLPPGIQDASVRGRQNPGRPVDHPLAHLRPRQPWQSPDLCGPWLNSTAHRKVDPQGPQDLAQLHRRYDESG